MINTVVVSGRLGADPHITNFDNGGKAAQFSIAITERGYKRQDGTDVPDRTDWIRIETGRTGIAGIIEKFLKKGMFVTIAGKLRSREWESKDGTKQYATVVQIETLDLPQKNGEQSNGSTPPPTPEQPKAANNNKPATVKNDGVASQQDKSDDDLPF